MPFDFKGFFYSLNAKERAAYCRRAGTTVNYLQRHVITRRKLPRPESMKRLAKASQGRVTVRKLLEFFYQEDLAA